jgi:hypothetical protein
MFARNRCNNRPVVRLKFKAAKYEADGRPSLYFESGTRDWMRVETQPESMSVLWSTRLPVQMLIHRVSRMLPAEAEVLLITLAGQHNPIGRRQVASLPREMMRWEREQQLKWGFLRLDFSDRVLTWESQRPRPLKALTHRRYPTSYRDQRRRIAHPGELGLLATGLDASYVSQLMRSTGTAGIVQSSTSLLSQAAPLAEGYPRVNLGRTEGADAWWHA